MSMSAFIFASVGIFPFILRYLERYKIKKLFPCILSLTRVLYIYVEIKEV
ncbi:hypothetical protein HMPREF1548_02191 [Clostridium sp. KLE 1755]|nr:hypothetical protein HMPREF1548_02191 [Clostridium sp. KLE 1755]